MMKIPINKIICGDALEILKKFPSELIDCVVTSPPYWALRDYGVDGQLGLEKDFNEYITKLCDIFDETKRVLKNAGTCWVNLGDTYYSVSGGKFLNDNISSSKKNITTGISKGNELKKGKELEQKNLCNIPARFSIEMQNRGWILRNTIIWHKPNCMPSSVKDRFTVDFEYLFFFSKKKGYWFKQQLTPCKKVSFKRAAGIYTGSYAKHKKTAIGIKTEYGNSDRFAPKRGRNKRCVWTITTKPFKGAHFAVYPEQLVETPIKAGCPEFICVKCGKAVETFKCEKCGSDEIISGVVLDCFFGAGTTGLVALKQNKNFVGIELNKKYIEIAKRRLKPFMKQGR